ncbi:unnamed protein product [Larinioides sclopetarius]|uniref:Uncharacterized protein n=1 Tax=Larinioides sclopetarius TaxID=280406 RepID=A0AAV1ZAG3_9ARAC
MKLEAISVIWMILKTNISTQNTDYTKISDKPKKLYCESLIRTGVLPTISIGIFFSESMLDNSSGSCYFA